MLFAFAALAAIGLVRGTRGRTLTLVGGLAAAFGSIQSTGLLYSDWVLEALENQLSMSQAVDIFEHVNGAASISVWPLTAKLFGLLGFPLLFAGLARAGVISWWLVPLSLLPMVAFGDLGGVVGPVSSWPSPATRPTSWSAPGCCSVAGIGRQLTRRRRSPARPPRVPVRVEPGLVSVRPRAGAHAAARPARARRRP